MQRMSERSTARSQRLAEPLRRRVRILRPDRMVLVDRQVVGPEWAVGEDEPGTVSLEKLTNRRTPAAIAASSTLKVLIMLLPKTTCGGLLHRLRNGGGVDDDLTAAREAYAAAASVRSACQ